MRKTIDEQIEDLQRRRDQLMERKKQLIARQKAAERKARTKRLIEIGAAVESVLGRPIEHEDLPLLIAFLQKQEDNGRHFSRAMKKKEENTFGTSEIIPPFSEFF